METNEFSDENLMSIEWSICPLTGESLENPVVIPECGHTFEKSMLLNYLTNYVKKCPLCKKVVKTDLSQIPFNFIVRDALEQQQNMIKKQHLIKSHIKKKINDYFSEHQKQANKLVREYIKKWCAERTNREAIYIEDFHLHPIIVQKAVVYQLATKGIKTTINCLGWLIILTK